LKQHFYASTKSFLIACLVLFSSLADAGDQGLLWQVKSPEGKVSYLLGTIHADDTRVTDFSPSLLDAFSKTEVFMMESLPPRNPSIFLMKNGNVAELLTEKEFDQVRELADFHSMHIEAAMKMKPWLLAVIFDLPKPKSMYSMDELLMAKAEEQNKIVLGLESTQAHFSVLDSISQDEQMVMLKAVLNRTQDEKLRDYEALLSTYQSGDLDKIASLDDSITGQMLPQALWEKMRIKLIDERNQGMANGMIAQAKDKSVFVAMGASHLAGKDGVINRLRQAGYELVPVNMNE
jgi:uncharacterized protein YbaP (TraB family)